MKRAGPEYVTDDDVRALAHGWNEAQPTPLPGREVYQAARELCGSVPNLPRSLLVGQTVLA